MFNRKAKKEMENYARQLSEAERLLFCELSKSEGERDAVLIAECNRNIAFIYNCMVYDADNTPPKHSVNKKHIFAGVAVSLAAVICSFGMLCISQTPAYEEKGYAMNSFQCRRSFVGSSMESGAGRYEYMGAIKLFS